MKIFTIALACCVLSIIACTSPNRDQKASVNKKINNISGTPEMHFVKNKVDFGNIPNDTDITTKFKFVNTGTGNLVVSTVSPDCSCTSFQLNKKVISPKDSGYIALRFTTKEKRGPIMLYSTVTTNTKTKFYILRMVANVDNRASKK